MDTRAVAADFDVKDPAFDVVKYLEACADRLSIQALRETVNRVIRAYDDDSEKFDCAKRILDGHSKTTEASNATIYKTWSVIMDDNLRLWQVRPSTPQKVSEMLIIRCS